MQPLRSIVSRGLALLKLVSYMRLLDIPIGLLINFHELRLVDGIHRLILRGANEP